MIRWVTWICLISGLFFLTSDLGKFDVIDGLFWFWYIFFLKFVMWGFDLGWFDDGKNLWVCFDVFFWNLLDFCLLSGGGMFVFFFLECCDFVFFCGRDFCVFFLGLGNFQGLFDQKDEANEKEHKLDDYPPEV